MEKKINAQQVSAFFETAKQEYIKKIDEIIYNALKAKGFNPDDRDSLIGHLKCRIYQPDIHKSHYYMDNVYIVSINTEWNIK